MFKRYINQDLNYIVRTVGVLTRQDGWTMLISIGNVECTVKVDDKYFDIYCY